MNVYLTIIDNVKKTGGLPKDKSAQYYNRYVQNLIKDGILIKIGYGTYSVNPDKEVNINPETSKHQVHGSYKVRGHGFIVTMPLPDNFHNWNRREEYLKNKNIDYINSKGSWKGQRIIIHGYKVWLTNKSIVIYCPDTVDFIGDSAEKAENMFTHELGKIISKLNTILNTDFRKFKIARKHFGKIKDALAKEFLMNDLKMKCYFNGECWQLIDNSKGYTERETVHNITSREDMDKIVIPFENSLKEHYSKTGESPSFTNIMALLNVVANNQVMYGENAKSHVEVIRELKEAVKELREEINKNK